jgi:putative transposase
VIDVAVTELEPFTSTSRACALLGKSRATLHRQRNPVPAAEKAPPGPRAPHPAALSSAEQQALLAMLDSERFADKSPAQVYAILLDEGIYLASIRTMYRVMTLADQVRERRAQAQHPPRVRPELVADGPDQVWTWDITKLKGPWRGTYFDLYVMLDIFSRKVIHWEVHYGESGDLAKAFMQHAIIANGGAKPRYIHADNGTSMTSKNVATLLTDLNITRSHSRPHVSNDNPFSEAALPGSGQGSHLPAPTDPDVNLSIHPARAVQSFGQYRSAQCANSLGARSRTPFSHSRARLSLPFSRLYFH